MVRGIRNNNPGNLRHGSKWLGLSPTQTDKDFCQFSEMKYGCRALLKLLQTYVTKYKCKNVTEIIHRYAPTNENNTEAYIKSVCSALNVTDLQKLDFSDTFLYLKLAQAIAKHECGNEALTINKDVWNDAYKMAFNI